MLTDNEKAALKMASEVLERIRELAIQRDPVSVEQIQCLAEAMHNTPRLIAQDERSQHDLALMAVEVECAGALLYPPQLG